MGWADGHIARLARGETVQCRPRGNSMTGKVNDGQLCTVAPLADHMLEVGGESTRTHVGIITRIRPRSLVELERYARV
ncbi:MAG: hypothetical protein JWO36_3169 [Myxococcales bacterium]|nr:hypothetical protein [Myxococcales bacterium]